MNRISKVLVTCLVSLGAFTSCNKFLDKTPDERTTLNSADKIKRLVTTAYPEVEYGTLLEHRTDNVRDNGTNYPISDLLLAENYHWKSDQYTNTEAFKLWTGYIDAIASANTALEAAEALGSSAELQAIKGEALLCRAFSEYCLVNIFAQAYNSQTSETDLGVPYLTKQERHLDFSSERLTVAEVYRQIEKDIQTALPLLDDASYEFSVQKYHFTKRAAYAFAANFYLSYEKWAEAKKYATLALGDKPAKVLRDMRPYAATSNFTEQRNMYIATNEPANLLLTTAHSTLWRRLMDERYAENNDVVNSSLWRAPGPWGERLEGFMVLSANNGISNILTKQWEHFEYTDKTAGIGYVRHVMMALTTDKALLVRAEAEALLGEFDAAAQDLSAWYVAKMGEPASLEQITAFYNVPEITEESTEREKQRAEVLLSTVAKPLNPRFATALQAGTQYNLIQAVLHARRIEVAEEGERWFDIKRYGIEISHELAGQKEGLTLRSEDPRRAIQIPEEVRLVGLKPNPNDKN